MELDSSFESLASVVLEESLEESSEVEEQEEKTSETPLESDGKHSSD